MTNDENFENYLREFQPRTPRALPTVTAVPSTWRRLAAAAVIAIACGGSLWIGLQEKQAGSNAGTAISQTLSETKSVWKVRITLTNQALENPASFEAELEKEASAKLPGLSGRKSTLSVLAKE
jgi:hypothetical protein